jgi:hypothetical protein
VLPLLPRGLSSVLIAETFTVDRTALLDEPSDTATGRLTPPYLVLRDRVFSAEFPILDERLP